jgi:hypothetical protein
MTCMLVLRCREVFISSGGGFPGPGGGLAAGPFMAAVLAMLAMTAVTILRLWSRVGGLPVGQLGG